MVKKTKILKKAKQIAAETLWFQQTLPEKPSWLVKFVVRNWQILASFWWHCRIHSGEEVLSVHIVQGFSFNGTIWKEHINTRWIESAAFYKKETTQYCKALETSINPITMDINDNCYEL